MKTFLLFLGIFACLKNSLAQRDTIEVTLNLSVLGQSLLSSPHETNVGIGQTSLSESIVYLPYKDETLKAFKLIEYDILPAELRKEVKTYYGQMLDDPTVGCRLTLANGEVRVNFNSPEGTIALERNVRTNNKNNYWLYKVEAILPTCGVEEHQHKNGRIAADHAVMFNTHGTQLRTYRLALLISSGFYAAAGGTNTTANAYIATIVNNLNGIFEKEIAVRFTLVSPNNPASTNVFSIYDTSVDLFTINTELNARYGSANFDVGHLLLPSGGGVANLGTVCTILKGMGLSGVSSASDVFVFAHELGHQFKAGHTFNGNGSGICGPTNRTNDDAYEPGSGNTIMSYSLLCSPSSYNIVGGRLLYFHTHSQESMINFIQNSFGSTCGIVSNTGNTAPVVAGLTSFTIPRNTPFTLTGSATDANSDPLTYTWEQYNLATVADTGRLGHTANTLGISAVNSPTAPLFRTVQSTSPTRNFPNLTYVLNNSNNPPDNIGEDLPNVARTLNFRLTVRDNRAGGGGVAFQNVAVVIADSGPFELTVGNGPTLWSPGQTKTITWNINETNIAPVNCSNVKISTSVDGGVNFTTLIGSTPNDGSYLFTVPNTPTSQFRIKIEAVGNIFFDINNKNITIGNVCQPPSFTMFNFPAFWATQNSENLNLNLKSRGNAITSFTGTLNNSSTESRLVFKNQLNNCSTLDNPIQQQFHTFISGVNGSRTFSLQSTILPFTIMNLYNSSYNSSNECENWLNSSFTFNTSTQEGSIQNILNQNVESWGVYQLNVSNAILNEFGSYTITVPENSFYEIIPREESPYDFTYVITPSFADIIYGFDKTADLRTLPPGIYSIFGLSYAGGTDLSPYLNRHISTLRSDISNSSFCGQLSTNLNIVAIEFCENIPQAPNSIGSTINWNEKTTLSATGCNGTYKWFDALNGILPIATGASFTTPELTSSKTYYVSCFDPCQSNRTEVVVNVISYCELTSNCSEGDIINNVTLMRNNSTIINQSSLCDGSGYSLYNQNAIDIRQGEVLSISVSKNSSWPQGLAVWIDFNRDGDFNDVGERIMQREINQIFTQNGTFEIPIDATLGITRMRVKIDYYFVTSNPCLSESSENSYGEVEDYLLRIVPSIDCPPSVTLTSPNNNINSGLNLVRTNSSLSAANPGLIRATNKVTGGNTTFNSGKKIELNQGFEVRGGAVFKAEIGGCAN